MYLNSICFGTKNTSNVFVFRGHGVKIVSSNGAVLSTGILLREGSQKNQQRLFSHYSSNIGTNCDFLEINDDFSNLDLAVFIGCETGAGGPGGNNLPTRFVELGAKAAIGFKNVISCDDANTWSNEFFHCMNSVTTTYTLKEAVSEACSESGISIYDITICIQNGQEDIVIW